MRATVRFCVAIVLFGFALGLAGCDATARMTPLAKAKYLLKHGKWSEAIAACNQVLASTPEEGAAYSCRGKAYLVLGDRDRALADFSEAMRLTPNEPENYYQRAVVYKDMGDKAKAQADEQIARKLDPMYSRAYLFNPDTDGPNAHHELPDVPLMPGQKPPKHNSNSADRRGAPKSQAEQFSGLNHPQHDETEEMDPTDLQIEGLKQKPLDYGQMSTTLQDTSGQPIVVDHRSMTEQLFGIQLPRAGQAPLQPAGPAPSGFSSGSRSSAKSRLDRSTDAGNNLASVPRLSEPISTAIGPPITGAGPVGNTGPNNSLGQPGYGLGGLPMQYPARSPYSGGSMRSTGLQDEDAAPRRSLSPYGPIASPYAPAVSDPRGYSAGGGFGGAGGGGYGAGAGRFGGPTANPYARQASPYSNGVPAGGRRELAPPPVDDLGP